MIKCGASISAVDSAVFYWFTNGKLIGLLASHVDDFIWAGNEDFRSDIVTKIRGYFTVGQEESKSFKYVGLHLESEEGLIRLDQHSYASSILPIPISKERERQKEDALTPEELELMRSKVGQILWIANQTRPDILFDASSLSAVFKKAKVSDLIETNKVVRRIQSENVTLKFGQLGHMNMLRLLIYSDASLGNLPDGSSQGGYIIFLTGVEGRVAPIAWQSKRIRRVVRSTLSAETLAMADAIDTGMFIAALFTELVYGIPNPLLLPFICITDNRSLFDTLHSTNLVHEKRLRIEISGIKELLHTEQISAVEWHRARSQVAVCLTKKGASPLSLLAVLEGGLLKHQDCQ